MRNRIASVFPGVASHVSLGNLLANTQHSPVTCLLRLNASLLLIVEDVASNTIEFYKQGVPKEHTRVPLI